MSNAATLDSRYAALTEIATVVSFLRWLGRIDLEHAIWMSAS